MAEVMTNSCTDEMRYANNLYNNLSENDKRLISAMMDMAFVLLKNIQQVQPENKKGV